MTSPYYDSGPLHGSTYWQGSGIDITVEVHPAECWIPHDDDTGGVCGWAGTVDIRWDGNLGTWICPGCSAEHEEQRR